MWLSSLLFVCRSPLPEIPSAPYAIVVLHTSPKTSGSIRDPEADDQAAGGWRATFLKLFSLGFLFKQMVSELMDSSFVIYLIVKPLAAKPRYQ